MREDSCGITSVISHLWNERTINGLLMHIIHICYVFELKEGQANRTHRMDQFKRFDIFFFVMIFWQIQMGFIHFRSFLFLYLYTQGQCTGT